MNKQQQAFVNEAKTDGGKVVRMLEVSIDEHLDKFTKKFVNRDHFRLIAATPQLPPKEKLDNVLSSLGHGPIGRIDFLEYRIKSLLGENYNTILGSDHTKIVDTLVRLLMRQLYKMQYLPCISEGGHSFFLVGYFDVPVSEINVLSKNIIVSSIPALELYRSLEEESKNDKKK